MARRIKFKTDFARYKAGQVVDQAPYPADGLFGTGAPDGVDSDGDYWAVRGSGRSCIGRPGRAWDWIEDEPTPAAAHEPDQLAQFADVLAGLAVDIAALKQTRAPRNQDGRRERIATAVMRGLLSDCGNLSGFVPSSTEEGDEILARRCVAMTDALLAALDAPR